MNNYTLNQLDKLIDLTGIKDLNKKIYRYAQQMEIVEKIQNKKKINEELKSKHIFYFNNIQKNKETKVQYEGNFIKTIEYEFLPEVNNLCIEVSIFTKEEEEQIYNSNYVIIGNVFSLIGSERVLEYDFSTVINNLLRDTV